MIQHRTAAPILSRFDTALEDTRFEAKVFSLLEVTKVFVPFDVEEQECISGE